MRKLSCILLIDDDDDDNFFHQIVAREADITDHVQVAENAFEALEYIKTGKPAPDLIFLDINMPKMNGWEFVDEYRKLNRIQNPVIIMLSTSLNPSDIEKSREIPEIKEFKTKPLSQ